MQTSKCCFILMCVAVLLLGCSASRTYTKPPLKSSGLVLAKSVEERERVGVPIDPGDEYSPLDEEVTAFLSFKNIAGKYLLRWDWHDPAGELYYSTGNFSVGTNKGKYHKSMSVWHSLKIKDDPASELAGQWMVKLYLNDDLMDYRTFTMIDIKDPTELPDTVQSKVGPHNWGLIIGIEQYAQLPQVPYARKDALVMKDYFQKVLGVPQENIIMLIDNYATKARIDGFIHNYLPKKVKKDTKLYVYFAGHGAPDIKAGSACIVPYDGDTRFLSTTGYQLKKLYAELDKLNIKQSYVFLDSCFSGMASRAADMLNQGTRPVFVQIADAKMKTRKVVAFSSSSAGETSNAYEETRHGLFTFFLLKALRGEADVNADKTLSVEEIYNYVSQQVSKTARRMGTEQSPTIVPNLEKIKNMSFSTVPPLS